MVPTVQASVTAAVLPAYVLLGGLMALVAVAFIRVLYGTEDLFERVIPRHDYLRHVAGMLAGYGVLVLLALMSRAPVLERQVGSDVLARWHTMGAPG